MGGIEIVVHNLALQQLQLGHTPTVIAPYPAWRAMRSKLPYRLLPLLPHSVVALEKLPADRRIFFAPLLRAYQGRYNFDIWHVHALYSAGFAASTFLQKNPVPAIVTCHGADIQLLPEVNYGQRLKPFVEESIRPIIPLFKHTVAISASMHTPLQELGASQQQIVDIPNGVDATRITKTATNRSETRQNLGWPPDKQIILTVGRNHRKKGYKYIPDIAAKLAHSFDNFLWVVVGRNVSKLQEACDQLDLAEHVQLHEEIGFGTGEKQPFSLPSAELIALYQAADIFAFPSLIESFGVVLLEAMAAGLAIVTNDVPGCRDVVQDGKTGLLAQPKDVADFAAKLNQLLDDKELSARLAEAGMRTALRYDWPQVSAEYAALYESTVA